MDKILKDIKLAGEMCKCPQSPTFDSIYCFTTENISGYMDKINTKNKKIITVGSSCDQVINYYLKGAKNVTLLDINPFIKYYYYLKKCSISSLKYKDFLKLFDYNELLENENLRNVVLQELKNTDYESFIFWSTILNNFHPSIISDRLFTISDSSKNVITSINPYLANKKAYKMTRKALKDVNPTFINTNIYDYNLDQNYDIMNISNIPDYFNSLATQKVVINSLKKVKKVIEYIYYESLNPNLNIKSDTYQFKGVREGKEKIIVYK